MEDRWALTKGQNALVLLTFLQADCGNSEYGKELLSLVENISRNEPKAVYSQDDGGLETDGDGDLESDGHLSSNIALSIGDILPSADVHWPVDPAEAEAFQQVAAQLREIAAQLEHNVVARATQNLSRNLCRSTTEHWKDHLRKEVENLLMQGVGLEHLHQERVIVALTFTLVKGVCQQAPRLLRSLFNTALQYIMSASAR